MLSSPESEKFASGPNGPRTPRAPSGLTEQYPASELSPPGSQDVQSSKQQKQPHRQQQQQEAGDEGLGLGSASAAFANSRKGIEGKDTEAVNTPGASWMNKRAEEEYQRAMEYVVDRDFSLGEISFSSPRFSCSR